jgi:lysophospholipase L1-like esterase
MKKRSIFVALLLAATLCLGTAPAVGADDSDGGYLALGDSVPFGYSPLVSPVNPAIFVGYPEAFARDEERSVTNASCPGETSGGLISLTAPDNGCRTFRFVRGFPLHASYSGTQLAFAAGYVQSHPNTRLISITIGANDLFLLQKKCEDRDPNKVLACILAGLPAMLTKLGQNLGTIYGTIRAAGYTGRLVAVTYYSLDYSDPASVAVITNINGVTASVIGLFGGEVADGFGAFQAAAAAFGGDSCKAGLLIKVSTTPLKCDVHPSPAGRDLLAEALQQVQRGPQN